MTEEKNPCAREGKPSTQRDVFFKLLLPFLFRK